MSIIKIGQRLPIDYDVKALRYIFEQFTGAVNRMFDGSLDGRRTQSAAPTSGTWQQGTIIWNSSPSAGGTVGWICTTSGTPGTWKAWGNIAA